MNLPTKKIIKDIQASKYAAMLPDIKEEKTQKFTTTVLTILALIFFGLFAIEPTLSTIANLQKQISDNQFIDSKLQDKINGLSVLQQKYSNIQKDLPNIYASIPQKSQIPLLFGDLQAIANDSSVIINGIQSSQVNLSGTTNSIQKYTSFAFNLSISGEYGNLKNFLSKIINMQRIITINNLSINKANIGNSTTLQLNIQGNAYFKE